MKTKIDELTIEGIVYDYGFGFSYNSDNGDSYGNG